MRSGHTSTKYWYTADECAENITNSPAFAHLTKEQIIEYLINHDGFGWDVYTYINVHGYEQESGKYDFRGGDKKTTYFDLEWLAKRLFEDFGCTCRICKKVHNDSGYEVNRRVGYRISDFLRDERQFYYPVLCMACADSASAAIWGKHKKAILYGIDNPTTEEVQLAMCAWMAEVVQRAIKSNQ